MLVYETILKRRSVRRFKQKPIDIDVLKRFVNAARLAPSAANLQVLEYFIVTDKKLCSSIFKTLGWAGYLEWNPSEEESPTAYIIILVRGESKYSAKDAGFASQNILLCAEEEGIGSCVLCNIDRNKIKELLKIPKEVEVDSVIALGYKAEQPVIEDMKNSVKYWKDENDVLHVPKRKLEDIIHINRYVE